MSRVTQTGLAQASEGVTFKTKGRACGMLLKMAGRQQDCGDIKENGVHPLPCTPCSPWTWTRSQSLVLPLPRLNGGEVPGGCVEEEPAFALEIENRHCN